MDWKDKAKGSAVVTPQMAAQFITNGKTVPNHLFAGLAGMLLRGESFPAEPKPKPAPTSSESKPDPAEDKASAEDSEDDPQKKQKRSLGKVFRRGV